MKFFAKSITTLSFFLLFCSNALAKFYIEPEKISATIIDSPFPYESLQQLSEIDYIIKLQKNAKKLEIKEATDEKDLKPEMVAQDIDIRLSRKDFPNLYQLLDNSQETAEAIVANVKNYWGTQRPFLVNKNVKALVKPSNTPSYPSGHTTESYISAHILGMLIPLRREDFRSRAKEIANHRVLAGMHFPKDLEGGRQLAFLILGNLMSNGDFQSDLSAAKKELEEKYFSKNSDVDKEESLIQ